MISYNALEVEGLKDVLETIGTACNHLTIDFFIVGALARNIWYANSNIDLRGTEDIDFGVYVSDVKTYEKLKALLIGNYEYIQAQGNAFCLLTPDGKGIDLMPFGEIAKDGEVMIEGSGMTTLKLHGFKEAYKEGSIDTQIEDKVYKSCSIPGIVVLKLIAYDDRPDRRVKDIKDITSICAHYADIESDMIWEEHSDLYGDNKSHNQVGLIVLGRMMRKIIQSNKNLTARIIQILDNAIEGKSNILEHMITDRMEETLDDKAKILKLIKQGLIE